MTYIASDRTPGRLSIRFILDLFGIDRPSTSGDDDDMPKVDPPANAMKVFYYNDTFQADFDAWKAEVEKDGNGALEITHEEPLVSQGQSMGVTILYRVVPRPAVAKRR